MATKLEKLERKLIAGGVSPEKAKLLIDTASDDTIAGVLETLANRDDDYSAQLGRVRSLESEKQRLEQVKADYDNWYYNQALPAMERLASGGNQPQPQPQPQPIRPTTPALEMKDVVELMKNQANNFASAIKDVGRISSRHAALYKEELDLDEIDKIATEKKLSIKDAYAAYVSPREEARKKAEFEAALKKAREEGIQEYTTKYGLPANPVPTEFNYVNRNNIPSDLKEKDESALTQELLNTWNTAGASAR